MSPRRKNKSLSDNLFALSNVLLSFSRLGADVVDFFERKKRTQQKNAVEALKTKEKEQRQLTKQKALSDKQQKLLHAESREEEVEKLNRGLARRDLDFKNILKKSLTTDQDIFSESLIVFSFR